MNALIDYLGGLEVTQGRLAGTRFNVLPWELRFVRINILLLAAQGWTQRAIANQFGMSHVGIGKVIKRFGNRTTQLMSCFDPLSGRFPYLPDF